MTNKVIKTDEAWRKELTPAQYAVGRQAGTERPFTGQYVHTKEDGTYCCAACGAPLFTSKAKFDSHCGWPSFFDVIDPSCVIERRDDSHGMVRTEVLCARCESHLGHVFDDGPQDETGLRYCINSVMLDLKKDQS